MKRSLPMSGKLLFVIPSQLYSLELERILRHVDFTSFFDKNLL